MKHTWIHDFKKQFRTITDHLGSIGKNEAIEEHEDDLTTPVRGAGQPGGALTDGLAAFGPGAPSGGAVGDVEERGAVGVLADLLGLAPRALQKPVLSGGLEARAVRACRQSPAVGEVRGDRTARGQGSRLLCRRQRKGQDQAQDQEEARRRRRRAHPSLSLSLLFFFFFSLRSFHNSRCCFVFVWRKQGRT